MKRAITIVLGIGALMLLGCSQPAGLSARDLTGIWREAATPHVVQFNENGGYRFSTQVSEIGSELDEVGQFQLEGTTLTFVTDADSHVCPGQTGTYEVELTEEGQLRLTLIEDECDYRASFNRRSIWLSVEP